MMSGPVAQIAPAIRKDTELNDKEPIRRQRIKHRLLFFPQTFNSPFLEDRQVAVGNRKNETGHARRVHLAILAAGSAPAAGAVIAPRAMALRAARVDDL